ncbi:hypothetical protein AWM68_20335 [Fictibacillus phosphorivorans]|uniref:Uncharacterized protein n=1 Tax=Fictibacillus phosphorivorans TaxID=1221500 RepID=A0A163RG06_9BACL|nr:hypothetical protein [Fictibacillus phosphorivorans]KZE66788.1 hypothetical protein AWM68_20335 [Fictibacillus phosphorivorans]
MDRKDSKNLERIANALEGIEKHLKRKRSVTITPSINVKGSVTESVKKELDKQFNNLNELYREG